MRSPFPCAAETRWLGQSEQSTHLQFLKTVGWGFGIVPGALAAVGLFAWRARRAGWVLAAFPVAYFIVMGTSSLYFVRFSLPLLPFLSLLSAAGILHLHQRLGALWGSRLPGFADVRRPLLALLVRSAAGQGILYSALHNATVSRTDSRAWAERRMAENLSSPARVGAERYSATGAELMGTGQSLPGGGASDGLDVEVLGALYERSLAHYRSEGYTRLVTSEFIRNRYPEEPFFYKELEEFGERVHAAGDCDDPPAYRLDNMYTPFWDLRERRVPGPCVQIYRIRS